jgi:hypothetical protein
VTGHFVAQDTAHATRLRGLNRHLDTVEVTRPIAAHMANAPDRTDADHFEHSRARSVPEQAEGYGHQRSPTGNVIGPDLDTRRLTPLPETTFPAAYDSSRSISAKPTSGR